MDIVMGDNAVKKRRISCSNLSPLQQNTITAAKNNQVSYIVKNENLYKRSDLDAKDQFGNTAVYYAVQNIHFDVLDKLLKLGADPNRRCELGLTPLHYAMMVGDRIEGMPRIISLLL